MRLHAHTYTHNHTHLYCTTRTHFYRTVSILGMTHKCAHLHSKDTPTSNHTEEDPRNEATHTHKGWDDTDTKYSIPSILAYVVMVLICASSIDMLLYMRVLHCACVKSTFPHAMPSQIASIKHVLNMLLFLNQNL